MRRLIPFLLMSFLVACKGHEVPGTKPAAQSADPKPKWYETDLGTSVVHLIDEDNPLRYGYVNVQGFWKSTSSTKDKQLVSPIAVTITCEHSDKMCRESNASLFMGILDAGSVEYAISSWTREGIVADDTDEGKCAIGHRLSIDFKSKTVTVTDYPKKMTEAADCKPLQDANSYVLHSGQIMLFPPAPYDPLEKKK